MDLSTIIANRKSQQDQQIQQSQNLINPSKIGSSGRPAGFFKSIIVDVISVLCAGLLGFSYYRYLTQSSSIWFIFIALVLFATMSVLQVFLLKRMKRTSLVIVLEVIVLLSFFWREQLSILLITGLIVLVMLMWGYLSARFQLDNSIEIPFFGVSGNVLGKFTTGILLFLILAYVPQLGSGNALVVSPQSFGTFFDWTAAFINKYYPTLSLNGSFGNFSDSFAKMELQNNPNFQALDAAHQDVAVQQASTEFAANFAKNSTDPIATSSLTSDAFYNVLSGVLSAWQNQNSRWFAIGWVTVLFIGLRTLGILFVWLGQFISLIFYEILLASGFMKVSEENHTKEIIGY